MKFQYHDWPRFPEGISRKSMSHEERENFHDENRKTAFTEIYESEGLQGIVELVNDLPNTFHIARTAARSKLKPS